MSLLSVDVKKGKPLFFKEMKLPAQEPRREAYIPIQVNKPPTAEEKAYSNLVARSPIVEFLVEALELVSFTTGKPLINLNLPEEKVEGYNEEGKDEIIDLIKIILDKDLIYKKQDIINSLALASKVGIKRAEIGFNLIVKAGALELTPDNNYYLTGSSINRINKVI